MDLHLGYRFLLVALILVANAFFSGAEVALLSVRQSRLRQMAADGVAGAQSALDLLANPEKLLAVVQVGVTLFSLGLGWAGEDTVFQFLVGLVGPFVPEAAAPILHGISFGVAFLLITYLHVLLAEVVPKNVALEKADRLAVQVAPVLLLFYRVVVPFSSVIEKSASAICRAIGLRGGGSASGHTTEEIKYIIASSVKHGQLGGFEHEAIERVLDLNDISAREVMVPRGAFVAAPSDANLDDLLTIFTENKYSRIPIYDHAPENVIGFVFAKDLLEVWHQRRVANQRRRPVAAFDVKRLLRQPLVVPETKPLTQVIESFRHSYSHMAIVVDEFGSVTGLLTLEDALEQIFGEIEDEHDVRLPPLPVVWDTVELEGSINILDLETQYGILVPSNAGFETLGGFLMFRLGAIPNVGDVVEHEGHRFTVTQMDRNRIVEVRAEKIQPPSPESSDITQ